MIKTITFIRFPFKSRMGGEELHTIKLAEYFRSKGFKVRLISSCPVLINEFKNRKFEVYEFFPFKAPVTKVSMLNFILKYPWNLFNFSRKFNADFFKNEVGTFLLNIGEKILFSKYLSKNSKKVIFMEHATIGNFMYKNPFLRKLKKIARLKNIAIVSVSKIMKIELEKVYSVQPVIIPNATYDFPKSFNERSSELRKIGYLGRFTKDKGSDVVLNLAKKFTDIKFLISTEIIKNKSKNIKCLGYLKDEKLETFWKEIDLLILPSLKIDPFGLVVLEAMQRKVPVIISDQVGAKDYFENDKEILISSPSNFESKIKKIQQNVSVLDKIKINAFKKVHKMTSDKMHQQYLDLLK